MTLKPNRLNTVGQTYHDFRVTKVTEVPEIQCVLRELVHVPTGAEVMHISNNDPENLFCLSFQTLPASSNGIAHVLEHTVLCGSEKFPVKDPFFAMTRRSLNTFMNALTGADFTCYPAATQIPQDFYSLLEVYIDAVFKPNLDELSFLQEGHRLEFAIPTDPHSPLMRKGIVFNEMKGALSSGSARLAEAMNKALFPNLPYGYNSGGDPKVIPELTYHELCAFHQQYYHPSRCLFFFYGNMPLEKHLDFLTKHALQDVKKAVPLPELPLQPRFTQPHHVTMDYPISSDEDDSEKTLIAFGWLTCHILKQEEVLALSVLEIILMDTDASPLKKAFLKSGLCKQASVYMDVDVSEVPLVITLRGCEPGTTDAAEKLMRETLEQIVEEGISLDAFERAMHQLEFARSEITGNHAPFGLSLFMRSALLKQHGGHPESGLTIHTLFEQLRRKHLQNPRYLTGLIQQHMLDNPHFVSITMLPSKELAAQEEQEESSELRQLHKQLTPGQVKQIIQKSEDLIQMQKRQEEEDLDVLPKITLNDVPKSSPEFDLVREKVGPWEVFHHDAFTNEIVYADLIFPLPDIAEEDLGYARLFTLLMSQMGCGGGSYSETLDYIQAHTGGVGAALAFNTQVNDYNQFFPSLYIRGKALHRKAGKLFSLFGDLITSIDFTDVGRLQEIVRKHETMLESTLVQNALRYALSMSCSSFDMASRLSNTWHGLEYYWMIKRLAESEQEIAKLPEKMMFLQERLLGLNNPHLVLTCTNQMYSNLKQHDLFGLKGIKTKPYTPWKGDYRIPLIQSQGRIVASPVAFTSQAIKTVWYEHPEAPALGAAACLFENEVLHKRIREQGGAYGGGASFSTLSGNFCFYAYRDPNISNTLVAFDEAVQTIMRRGFEDSDLEEAKLEIVQGLDAPVAPGSRGEVAYSRFREGKTFEVRQQFRDRLLALTAKDVCHAIEKHIAPQMSKATTVILAGKELLERENKVLASQHKGQLPIFPT